MNKIIVMAVILLSTCGTGTVYQSGFSGGYLPPSGCVTCGTTGTTGTTGGTTGTTGTR